MPYSSLNPQQKWHEGSRDKDFMSKGIRGYKVRKLDQYIGQREGVPELLRLKKIQEVWNSEANEDITTA